MKPICVTLEQIGRASKTEAIGLRTAAIILKVLDDADYIEAWPRGRGELHWKVGKVSLHLTKIDEGED